MSADLCNTCGNLKTALCSFGGCAEAVRPSKRKLDASPYSGVPLALQVVKLPPLAAHLRSSHPAYATTLQRRGFIAARLEVRHDPQTERWTVVLVSRTTKEDVVVAWKQTEQDAAEWARNYGVRP